MESNGTAVIVSRSRYTNERCSVELPSWVASLSEALVVLRAAHCQSISSDTRHCIDDHRQPEGRGTTYHPAITQVVSAQSGQPIVSLSELVCAQEVVLEVRQEVSFCNLVDDTQEPRCIEPATTEETVECALDVHRLMQSAPVLVSPKLETEAAQHSTQQQFSITELLGRSRALRERVAQHVGGEPRSLSSQVASRRLVSPQREAALELPPDRTSPSQWPMFRPTSQRCAIISPSDEEPTSLPCDVRGQGDEHVAECDNVMPTCSTSQAPTGLRASIAAAAQRHDSVDVVDDADGFEDDEEPTADAPHLLESISRDGTPVVVNDVLDEDAAATSDAMETSPPVDDDGFSDAGRAQSSRSVSQECRLLNPLDNVSRGLLRDQQSPSLGRSAASPAHAPHEPTGIRPRGAVHPAAAVEEEEAPLRAVSMHSFDLCASSQRREQMRRHLLQVWGRMEESPLLFREVVAEAIDASVSDAMSLIPPRLVVFGPMESGVTSTGITAVCDWWLTSHQGPQCSSLVVPVHVDSLLQRFHCAEGLSAAGQAAAVSYLWLQQVLWALGAAIAVSMPSTLLVFQQLLVSGSPELAHCFGACSGLDRDTLAASQREIADAMLHLSSPVSRSACEQTAALLASEIIASVVKATTSGTLVTIPAALLCALGFDNVLYAVDCGRSQAAEDRRDDGARRFWDFVLLYLTETTDTAAPCGCECFRVGFVACLHSWRVDDQVRSGSPRRNRCQVSCAAGEPADRCLLYVPNAVILSTLGLVPRAVAVQRYGLPEVIQCVTPPERHATDSSHDRSCATGLVSFSIDIFLGAPGYLAVLYSHVASRQHLPDCDDVAVGEWRGERVVVLKEPDAYAVLSELSSLQEAIHTCMEYTDA